MHRTMIRNLKNRLRADAAVSPVVGTIMMVAVTVALAATVLTVMNSFGDDAVRQTTDAVFKVQAVDTDGNGKTDKLKLTYISGPTAVPEADVAITISDSAGASMSAAALADGTWDPGDFQIFDVGSGGSQGSWFTTVSILGSTVVDTSVSLDE